MLALLLATSVAVASPSAVTDEEYAVYAALFRHLGLGEARTIAFGGYRSAHRQGFLRAVVEVSSGHDLPGTSVEVASDAAVPAGSSSRAQASSRPEARRSSVSTTRSSRRCSTPR